VRIAEVMSILPQLSSLLLRLDNKELAVIIIFHSVFACYELACVVLDNGSSGGRCDGVSVIRCFVVAEKGE